MIGGFNHNIRYKGRVFHVQTEDLGPKIGRIRTHVFFNGAVVAEASQNYGDLMRLAMTQGQRIAQIRGRMQELHKNGMKLLSQGAYDLLIQQRLQSTMPPGPPPGAPNPNPSPVDDPELRSLLGEVQTARPSAHQSPPELQQNAAEPQVVAAEPEETSPSSEPEEDIPGRAKRLFPKREHEEDVVSDEERMMSAKVSRSESSMVKNRKIARPKKDKEAQDKEVARQAARSRGAHPSPKPTQKPQATSPVEPPEANMPEAPPPEAEARPPAGSTPVVQYLPVQPPNAAQMPPNMPSHFSRPAASTPPQMSRYPVPPRRPISSVLPPAPMRPRTNPPQMPSTYPMQPLPHRAARPLTPAGSRPPVAIAQPPPHHAPGGQQRPSMPYPPPPGSPYKPY